MVNECFVLSAAALAALFAEDGPADYARLRSGLPPWTLFYTVAGYDYYPKERVDIYRKDITALAMRLGVEPAKAVGSLSARDILRAVQRPSSEPYWKLRPKGSFAEVCFLAINDRVGSLVEVMQGLVAQAGYAPADVGTYVQPIVQGTGCHVGFDLFYDPADRRETAQVRNLCRTVTQALMNAGAFFSRPYGENARDIMNRDAASLEVLKKLKGIFDPNHIMNPGKLCF